MSMKKWTRILASGALFFFSMGHFLDLVSSQPVSPQAPLAVPYYSPPTHMDLCGERVPLDTQDAKERFDREFTIVVYSHAQVYLWLKRLERYFPFIEKQLNVNKLPGDLKYVAVAESDLLTSACSPAGAAGPWQFIPSTGSNYGLDQSKHIDERHDFELATGSAFRYLKDLHGLFQNWTLAIAAYNCGEKRVESELKRQKVSTYYALKLPLETERYIFRILAIKEVLSNPERYGYSLPKEAAYPPLPAERVKVSLPCAMPVQTVSEAAGMTYRDFKIMNPSFISDSIPAGSYNMKVPAGKGGELQNRLQAVKIEYKPQSISHKVKKGETLSGIAAHYGVSPQDMRQWNGIKGDRVQVGKTLKIMK
jgi:membrane-bound lytic murein transglycosylase D